jgi:hypothetical protein
VDRTKHLPSTGIPALFVAHFLYQPVVCVPFLFCDGELAWLILEYYYFDAKLYLSMSESEEDGHHIIKETSAAQCSKLSYCWASIPAQSLWAAGFLFGLSVVLTADMREARHYLRWTLFGPFSREAWVAFLSLVHFYRETWGKPEAHQHDI